VKAFIALEESLDIRSLKRNDCETRTIPWVSYEAVRSLIAYTDFLGRVGFTFALVSMEKRALFDASSRILIHRGFTVNETMELMREQIGYSLRNDETTKLREFAKYVSLFDLDEELKKFYEINELVHLLRHECPWDREQTHKSLVPELIEESLELAEEIIRETPKGIEEELGDTLLQILFHIVLGEENGDFNFSNVTDILFEKLYERHPHVFGDSKVSKSKQVLDQWESIKKSKHKEKGMNISKILASFITTVDAQENARKEGLDFANVHQIEAKINEELSELKEAMAKQTNIGEEVGDLLFSVINLARFLNIDPSHALFLSMNKFEKRFSAMKMRSKDINRLSDSESNKIWERVKDDEQSSKH
jgi:MazG family protein